MENRAHALSAGLFLVFLCIGLAVVAIRLTGDTGQRVNYLVESKYPVSGLQQNAPVRLRGVNVGKVGDIRFAHNDPRLILVRIVVDPATPLTRGTYAQLGFLGITGLSFVQLDDDGSRPERLASSAGTPARIPMRPSVFDQVSGSGQELVQYTAQAAKRVSMLLNDENLSELSEAISNINAASANFTVLTEDLQSAVKALTKTAARTDTTLQRLDPLLDNLNNLTMDVGKRVDALDRIGKSAEDLGKAGRALEAIFPNVNSVLDDLSRSLRTVDRVLAGIEQQPQSLLFGRKPPPPGPGEQGYSAPAFPP
ncbi:MAG: ABC-type transport system involved in resistance to organic solvent [Burkholderia sp.]|nr:ABC-type transport system involved in resistance to organic solvent [Burkholderia sp.]